MKLQTILAITLTAGALTACKGSGGGDYVSTPGGSVSSYDVAWDQGYAEVQQTQRSSKTYELLDYTRRIYFEGYSGVAQTQQRLALILQNSRAVRISSERMNRFIVLATDARSKEYGSKQLLTRHRRR